MKLYQFYLIFELLVTYAASRSVKFGLVAFGTNAKVKIDKTTYAMTQPNTKDPYYTLTQEVSDNKFVYKYVVDDVEEEFNRVLPAGETTTHNEFYGRKDTVKKLPEFNHPDKGSWKKSIGKTSLFDDSYIPTVHLYGTNANNTFVNASASILKRATFILKDDVISVKNAAIYTKNRNWDKFQFRLVLNYSSKDTSGIYGRYVLKFRDNNEDPTFFRQKLYADIMNTLGVPTTQTIFVRVYVNKIPVGLYVLQEEAASESFVRSAFHGDNNGNLLISNIDDLGHPLDCSTGADFEYNASSTYGSFKPYNATRYNNSRIKDLAKAFSELNINNYSAIEKFDKNWFDINTFFKAIAMEYLTGHWDSYWFYSTNFAMYDDPTESTATTSKFYFICQDWDGTFGLNLGEPYTRFDEEFTTISYERYVNIDWKVDEYDAPHRYAIDKLLSNPKLKARFEKILTDIVRYIMNPKAFNKRLDAFVDRFRDEVEFTFNVTPWRKGTTDIKWTMDDFDRNIKYKGRYGASYGLKEYVYKRASFINKEFNLGLDLGENLYENIKECGDGFGKCSDGKCCSKYGYCGNTEDHCNISSGCQVGYGICNEKETKANPTNNNPTSPVDNSSKTTTTSAGNTNSSSTENISTDGLCGPGHGKCPNDECCSKYGYCGSEAAYCGNGCQVKYGKCDNSTSGKKVTTKKATNGNKKVTKTKKKNVATSTVIGRCGSAFGGACANSSLCCSKYGYCGTSKSHCGKGCQPAYGICN